MPKISNLDIVRKDKVLKDFPPVVVDQRNYRISEIIKRNMAGEQVMGDTHMSYDYSNTDQKYDPEKVNPFVDMGFDLDDVIILAKENGQKVTDLQNRLGEFKAQLDKAKQEEAEQNKVVAPAVPPADSAKKD